MIVTKNKVSLIVLILIGQISFAQTQKTLIDFFLPMPPQSQLISEGIWGNPNVLPRDTANGLEDPTMKNWCYWDGSIVKGSDKKYRIYGSRWTQSVSHSDGWHIESKGIIAVSNNVIGPYKDEGLLWPDWKNGIGGNVVGLRLKDGRYAVVTSEITKGEIFVSDKPDGPFKLLGEIKVDTNGFDADLVRYDKNNVGAVKVGTVGNMANVMIILRPDGSYLMIPRSTAPMLSTNGILGPYKVMGDRIYKGMEGIPQERMEDPTVWYSGGMYHMVVNNHGVDTSYHFSSPDGIHDWKYRGIAFKKDADIFKYTNGIINNWAMVQRMTVFVENGHPTHFIFSVLDVKKGQDNADDNHGSKIVVVPFDGKAFDKHMQKVVNEGNKIKNHEK